MKYVVNELNHPPVRASRNTPIDYVKNYYPLAETIEVDENGDFIKLKEGVSMIEPSHVAAILGLYEELKAEGEYALNSDLHYLMEEFDEIFLKEYAEKEPEHFKIAIMKIKGMTNAQIQAELKKETGITHTYEYLSCLWTTKIPKEISEMAIDKYIYWYYTTQKPGVFKKCSKCGQIKLRNGRFFSKNKTAKDGYYSQCKDCRNATAREKNRRMKEKLKEEMRNGEIVECQN